MSALRMVLSMALTVILVGAVSAEEKKPTNKEKIVGTWEFVKGVGSTPNGVATFEFTKDGKYKATTGGEAEPVLPYEVTGDDLKIKFQMWKIKTLTDKELVIESKEDGKTTRWELKKK